MKKLIALFSLSMLMLAGLPAYAKGDAEQGRAEVRQTAQQILNELYSTQPSARQAIQSSAGYAVFSNFGMKSFLPGVAAAPGWQSITRPRKKFS